jgi:hypothetical protein
MTTFTLQDLTPAQQEAVKHHEAMLSAYSIVNNRSINNLPTTPEEDEAMRELFEKMGQDLTAQHAPVPQPTQMGEPLPKSQVSPEALIEHMVAQFSTNLRLLLSTVISQSKAQPEGDQSLQECVSTTLQQADWLKDMVKEAVEESIDQGNFEDAVSSQVGACVDSYFCHEFSLDDHCDVNSMVSDKVDDCLEEVVAEKLSEASVSISF